MLTFDAPDGTALVAHELGAGDPLVVLPGGPMQNSRYLGDLGGLAAHRRLVRLDLRGTGDSATPADPASYRCERQVADVQALLDHLGLARADVLGHSAGTNLALLHAAVHPERVGRLVLVTPSPMAFHGRWDDPAATRSALAGLDAPVLVLAGELDLNSPPAAVAEIAAAFARAELVVQPGAGHYPWADDPERFVATVAGFLG